MKLAAITILLAWAALVVAYMGFLVGLAFSAHRDYTAMLRAWRVRDARQENGLRVIDGGRR
jgi:hypothetical protein